MTTKILPCCAIRIVCTLALAVGLPIAALAAPPTWLPIGQASENILQQVEDLKVIYLECDKVSRKYILDTQTASFCSSSAEDLRRIGFDGRFEDLFAWWKKITYHTNASHTSNF